VSKSSGEGKTKGRIERGKKKRETRLRVKKSMREKEKKK